MTHYKTISSNPKVIRSVMESVGSRIGSVLFKKRSDGSQRSMCYRLHVKHPSVAREPKGLSEGRKHKDIDLKNSQITVFDCNKTIKDLFGEVIGRGGWRTVPLENVERLVVNGTTYLIKGRENRK